MLNLSTKHSPFEDKPKFKVCISASSELFKNCHNVCVFQQFSESHTTEIPIFAEYCKNGCRSRSFWDHRQNSERWDPTTPNLLEFDPQHFEKFNTDRRRNSKHIVKSFNHKNYIQTCMADCTTSYNLRTRPQQLVTTTFLISMTQQTVTHIYTCNNINSTVLEKTTEPACLQCTTSPYVDDARNDDKILIANIMSTLHN